MFLSLDQNGRWAMTNERVQASRLDDLHAAVARLERGGTVPRARVVLPFGHRALDGSLLGGGLALGALHEVAGAGPDVEHGAAAALFAAGVLARLEGTVLWVLERHDLFAPALAGVGLHPARVPYAEAGRPASVLLVMEEGLRHSRPRRRDIRAPDAHRLAPLAVRGRGVGHACRRTPPLPPAR